MKIPFLLGVAAALIGFSLIAAADDGKSVEGVWKPVRAELAGKPMSPALLDGITLEIRGDRYKVIVKAEGGPSVDEGTCRLDATSKPKRLTITGTDGPNKGKTFAGIYEMRGKALRICYDLSGAATPRDFKTVKGTRLFLATYQRQKR
jgi:uncharacterized protein (TIGR03067 family)